MKFIAKSSSDFRSINGDFITTVLLELTPSKGLGRVPSNVVFLLDSSSSMGGDKWTMVKQAAIELISSLQDDDRVALVTFDSSAKEIFPLASLAENREVMKEAIKKMESPCGVTNLNEGLKVAYRSFEKRTSSDKVKRVNHVILLTDGFPTDNEGYRVENTDVYEKIVRQEEHITLTGVGIGSADDYDANFINKLSDLGRGSYYHANDIGKFKEKIRAEIEKLQSSVVGELKLRFSDINGRMMRIAKVSPEIVIYDVAGSRNFELKTGSMTKDMTSFIVQMNSQGTGSSGSEIELFSVEADYDGKITEKLTIRIKTTDKETDYSQIDSDVFKALQILQVHLNSEKIQESLSRGEREKATRLIENTTRIADNLGQDKVTRALTRLSKDIEKGKSVSDDLATIKDESKKTRLLM